MNNGDPYSAYHKARLSISSIQEAALAYAERKLDNPDTERDPLTLMEKDAIEFLKKHRADEPEHDTDRN